MTFEDFNGSKYTETTISYSFHYLTFTSNNLSVESHALSLVFKSTGPNETLKQRFTVLTLQSSEM